MKYFKKFWRKEMLEIDIGKEGPFKMPINICPKWRVWFMKKSGRYMCIATSDGDMLVEKKYWKEK